MAGLKELWGLGDPAALDPQIRKRFEKEIQAFSAAMDQLNAALRYTAANAALAIHDKLAKGRDVLISRYQQALSASNESALQDAVAKAELLARETAQIADTARMAKTQWEQQAPVLEAAEEFVAQSTQNSEDVTRTEQGLVKIAEKIARRDYQVACDILANLPASATSFATASSAPGAPERRFALGDKLPADPIVPLDPAALESWNNPLVTGDPRDLFTADRMDAIVEMEFAGAGSKELNEAMRGLLFAAPNQNVSQHLAAISQQRGLDPQAVQVQYERFQQLQSVANQLETVRGLPADDVMTTRREEYLRVHGEFLGSPSSMRFGQVVGEATGLDPAFAAMLNPTGGMVGPGMDVLAPTDANSPIIWHGIFHDAGGYLLNYQNSGTGYTYLPDKQPKSGRRGEDPLQGQVEGISYWYERKQPHRSLLEDLYEFDFTADDPAKKELVYDRYVKHPIDDAEAIANSLTQDGVEEVREFVGDAREFNRDAVQSLTTSACEAADAVQRQIDEANESLDALAMQARELGVNQKMVSAAQAAIKAELASAHANVEAWEQRMTATFAATGQYVDDNLAAVDTWAEESGAVLQRESADQARELEQAIRDELIKLASDRDLQETLQSGINRYAETKQDAERLIATANRELESAKARVNEFYDAAVANADAGKERAARELTGIKNDLIDKLSRAQKMANRAVDSLLQQVDDVAYHLADVGQDLLDSTGGVKDSLADAVGSGTDTLAHTLGSATVFAANRLDRLTKLLG